MNEQFTETILFGPTLPSLPAVAVRVLELTAQDDVDLDELANVIQADQALTARIIRTMNSSYYGLPKRCSSIRQAVGLLGLNAVKALVLGFSLVQSITGHEEYDIGFDYLQYWRRAVYSAAAARLIARQSSVAEPDEAFLAALMQDIGMIAIYRATTDRYLQVIDMSHGDHHRLVDLEHRTFEVTHPQVGAQIMESWRFPKQVIEAIRCHHCVESCPEPSLDFCRVVVLAGDVAEAVSSQEDREPMLRCLHRCESWFEMTADQSRILLGEAVSAADELGRHLQLDTGETPEIGPILARAEEMRTSHALDLCRKVDELEARQGGGGHHHDDRAA